MIRVLTLALDPGNRNVVVVVRVLFVLRRRTEVLSLDLGRQVAIFNGLALEQLHNKETSPSQEGSLN